MNAEYWAVGQSTPSPLALTPADFSKHLVADWVPSMPASVSAAFMGWPIHLTDTVRINQVDYVMLKDVVRGSERQWKGVLSWMLGVVGTRHVLEQEGYRWVAPLSAFYPEAVQKVDLSTWHAQYPRSVLAAGANPAIPSKLRPDYIALRPQSLGGDWAIAESKGTSMSLTKKSACPSAWANQARNALVTLSGQSLAIPRHMVVATRCNPNAVKPATRRVQVRAWNSEIEGRAPADLMVEVATAHLFGVCRNLGLRYNAMALALATEVRRERRAIDLARGDETDSYPGDRRDTRLADIRFRDALMRLGNISGEASSELESFRQQTERGPVTRVLESDGGPVEVQLDAATVRLVVNLWSAVEPEEAAQAVRIAEDDLNERYLLTEGRSEDPAIAHSLAGVRITLPRLLR